MIKLFIRNISPLFNGEWIKYLPILPPERRCLAQRFRKDHDSARSVGAWLLLRDSFAREHIDVDALALDRTEYGKPFFKGCPEFSISHAGPYAAVAISEDPVGVDVEGPDCTPDIAEQFFSPAEFAAAQALSGSEQRLYLQRLWVAKEAFVKAIGTGISTPFDAFCVMLDGERIELWQDLTPLPIRIADFPAGDYRVAVAGVGRDVQVEFLP